MASRANDLKDFLKFVKSLWAILATTSVLFPFASRFRDLIPIKRIEHFTGDESFPFYYLPPPLIPLVTTLFCAFIILMVFNQRSDYRDLKRRPILMGKSMLSFLWGLFGLLTYLGLRNIDVGAVMYEIGLGQFINIKRIIKFVVDIMMLCSYSLFFGMITRAFMLQGIITYYGRSDRQT